MYPDTMEAREAFRHDIDYTGTSAGTSESSARTAWGWMTAAVEVRSKARRSAFYFGDDEGFLRDNDEGRKDEAQFSRHAAEIFLCQHRVFVFLVYVCKTKARLARWDRTGCVVSTPIDLKTEPSKLLNFVFRLGLMSPKELGYDTTAVLATPAEVQRLSSIHHVNRYALNRAEEILRPETRMFHPIYKARLHIYHLCILII